MRNSRKKRKKEILRAISTFEVEAVTTGIERKLSLFVRASILLEKLERHTIVLALRKQQSWLRVMQMDGSKHIHTMRKKGSYMKSLPT